MFTYPQLPAEKRYQPYAEELQRLRQELHDRWQRFIDADPDEEPEWQALGYEVLASDRRIQGLIIRAQREQEIQRLEAEVARYQSALSSALDDSMGDPVDLKAVNYLDHKIPQMETQIEVLRSSPVTLPTGSTDLAMLARMHVSARAGAHP